MISGTYCETFSPVKQGSTEVAWCGEGAWGGKGAWRGGNLQPPYPGARLSSSGVRFSHFQPQRCADDGLVQHYFFTPTPTQVTQCWGFFRGGQVQMQMQMQKRYRARLSVRKLKSW